MNKDAKLSVEQNGEVRMAEIICTGCGIAHRISYEGYLYSRGVTLNNGKIQGTLTCAYQPNWTRDDFTPCGARTVFEIIANSVSFLPGKLFEEDLVGVSDVVGNLFSEAVYCYYGRAYKGTLGLCRSTIEQALDEKNVPGKDLFEKIRDCPASIMGVQEKTWADATRLNGRDALHRLMNVTASQALGSLNLTITLVNHIAAQPPLPAKP